MTPTLRRKSPSLLLKGAIAVALALLLASLTGCGTNKKEAQALAKSGGAVSDSLATFYDSLVQANAKSVRIVTYRAGPLSKIRLKELDKEKAAYASRADLARKLNATYVALGKLIDFDVAADLKVAVGDLTTAVLKQVPHPDELDGDLFKTVINKIAGRLAEIQQEKQFRRNAPRVLEILDGVGELFERERYLYVQTLQLKEDEALKFALRSLGNGNCEKALGTGVEALADLYEPYRIKLFLTPETNAQNCRRHYDLFAAQFNELAQERKEAARGQARSLSIALYNLERHHREFLHEKAAAPSLTASDLTNSGRLLAALKEAMTARAAWEKNQEQLKRQRAPQPDPTRDSNQNEGEEDGPAVEAPDEPEYVPVSGAVADYVARLLSPGIKETLEKGGDTSSAAFRTLFLADLNRIIETGNIFEGALSKDSRKTLEEYRKSTRAATRPALRNSLIQNLNLILSSDRAIFSGARGTYPASTLSDLAAADPAAKPLAELNRAILAFVFAGAIAEASAS
jgi:hypothetical protein